MSVCPFIDQLGVVYPTLYKTGTFTELASKYTQGISISCMMKSTACLGGLRCSKGQHCWEAGGHAIVW